MCIYCGTKYYRKIYENHYGPIPKEQDGRSYEIHHVDGNHENYHITNLIALTLQEHYDIHFSQGNWGACLKMATRLGLTPQQISEISKRTQHARIENGTHPFQRPGFNKEMARLHESKRTGPTKANTKRVTAGTHNFMRRKDGTSVASDRITAGTHPLMRRPDGSSVSSDRVRAGKHPWQKTISGPTHPKYDNTVYCFIHKLSGEIINNTRHGMMEAYNLSDDSISKLLNGKHKSAGSWRLSTADPAGSAD